MILPAILGSAVVQGNTLSHLFISHSAPTELSDATGRTVVGPPDLPPGPSSRKDSSAQRPGTDRDSGSGGISAAPPVYLPASRRTRSSSWLGPSWG